MSTIGRTQSMGVLDDLGAERYTEAPFATALTSVARRRDDIVGLSADLSKYTDMLPFAAEFPDRFFNVGMAEQDLVCIAAGLSKAGFTPVATTYGVFATRRALDFIAIQCAYARANVKIVAGLPGLTTGYGATHQAIDDLAHVRALPNMVVIDPADAVELAQATEAILDYDGPVYMRLLRGRVPELLDRDSYRFEIGKARLVRDGDAVTLVTTGMMLERALAAARTLADGGISASVLNASTIKPFDTQSVVELARATGAIVTVENHSVIGGLYSAVSEALVAHGVTARVEAIGLQDEFGECGSLPYLAERHGVTAAHIEQAARRVIAAREKSVTA
jgi:transketolase